jgi:hypothetical protein
MAFEKRVFILDFKSVEKSFVAFIGFVSMADAVTTVKMNIDNMPSPILISHKTEFSIVNSIDIVPYYFMVAHFPLR